MSVKKRRRLNYLPPIWPNGASGDLVIGNGETVTWNATNSNQYYDYNSIDIQAGGTLELKGKYWHIIGVKNNFTINGNLFGFENPVQAETIAFVSPDGYSNSYSNEPQGPTFGKDTGTKFGGGTFFGYGTGGGGASAMNNGGDATETQGGHGGAVGTIGPIDDGAGATTPGENGFPGLSNDPTLGHGSGGGGGYCGWNGVYFYLRVLGDILGSGVIAGDGDTGGSGGIGKTRNAGIPGSIRGGGGGGAPGGNASNPIIRCDGSISGTLTYSFVGGSPGQQGTGPNGINASADFGLNGGVTFL